MFHKWIRMGVYHVTKPRIWQTDDWQSECCGFVLYITKVSQHFWKKSQLRVTSLAFVPFQHKKALKDYCHRWLKVCYSCEVDWISTTDKREISTFQLIFLFWVSKFLFKCSICVYFFITQIYLGNNLHPTFAKCAFIPVNIILQLHDII